MKYHDSYKIHAAHRLSNSKNKKENNLHGHTFSVEVFIEGEEIEMQKVKDIVMELDHTYLNEKIQNPTAENIEAYLEKKIVNALQPDINKMKIRIWEMENYSIENDYRGY